MNKGTVKLVLLISMNVASGLGNREYGRGDLLRLPRDTPLSAKVGSNFTDFAMWCKDPRRTGSTSTANAVNA
jgi:hypothetical protein